MATLVTLPPQLLDRIRSLIAADPSVPGDLRGELEEASRAASEHSSSSVVELSSTTRTKQDACSTDQVSDHEDELPPTIDMDVLERLSRWATSDAGSTALNATDLEPAQFLLVSLLAGTEIYLTPKQRALLLSAENPDNPSPYLPAYLSPAPPSFAGEYRPLAQQLSTILNILFSIFGSAAAVYVAAITGAGYTRETAVILAILAAAAVGLADGVIVWVYVDRLDRGRREAGRRAAEVGRGSGKVEEAREGEDEGNEMEVEERVEVAAAKRGVRLRRRGLRDKQEQPGT